MNILYLSCHAVLEYDELRILHDLGHKVFSIGGYIEPRKPHVDTRPPLDIETNDDLLKQFHSMNHANFQSGISADMSGRTFTKEFLDNFDCIIVMHNTDWIDRNLELFRNRLVILRTIGQNISTNELKLQNLRKSGIKILRYSPKESDIKNYAGEDGMIRFLKYESDFLPRTNTDKTAISFCQSLDSRGRHCGSKYVEYVASKVNFSLYGPGNEKYPFSKGKVPYSELTDVLSKSSCYFYTGTYPAQYVLNFIEAMMSGIPIVSIGENLMAQSIEHFPVETCDILDKVATNLYSNNCDEILFRIHSFMTCSDLNVGISNKQKNVGNILFSAEKNMNQWNLFLDNL